MSLTKTEDQPLKPVSQTPYQLDPAQTLRAANALLKKMQADQAIRKTKSGKADLLSDAETESTEPIWLCITTKKHITDKKSLKPGKIHLPHPITSGEISADGAATTKVCLITADPQRRYKDLIDHPNFTAPTRSKIARVLGLEKLKDRCKSFESRRLLLAEYDLFLADDRVVTYLPKLLGKVFYHGGSKRPIPISLQGRRESTDAKGEKRKPLAQGGTKQTREQVKPEALAKEIERALECAYVHLSPGTNTSVKVGHSGMPAEDVQGNIEVVVEGLVSKYIPQGWRNVKGLHVKGPNTASLPIWLAQELWEKEDDVRERDPVQNKAKVNKKRKAIDGGVSEGGKVTSISRDGPAEGESLTKKSKKRKSDADDESVDPVQECAEKKARKEALKQQKMEALKEISAAA